MARVVTLLALAAALRAQGADPSDECRVILIAGAGRAGTTFLVEELTALHAPTGFTPRHIADVQATHAHAGLERGVSMKDGGKTIECHPRLRIFKSPFFTSRYAQWIGASNIEAVIIPIRDARGAAHSRGVETRGSEPDRGGFVGGARNEEEQLRYNTQIVYDFINALAAADLPMIFLNYPRHVEDPAYAYRRLAGVLKNMNISKSDFIRGHNATFHANFVHSNHTTLASGSSRHR